MLKNLNFTTDQLIAIAAIGVPVLVAIFVFVWTKVFARKHVNFHDELSPTFIGTNPQTVVRNILAKNGTLELKALKLAHVMLMANTQVQPGTLRTLSVEISSAFAMNDGEEIVGTQVVKTPSPATKVYAPEEVEAALETTIKKWNSWVTQKDQFSKSSRIQLVARFQTYFQAIHPFNDGNGRLGRQLANEQLSYLLDEVVVFSPKTEHFYEAIRNALSGDESKLILLLAEAVHK
jgi:hypothetical protein